MSFMDVTNDFLMDLRPTPHDETQTSIIHLSKKLWLGISEAPGGEHTTILLLNGATSHKLPSKRVSLPVG